MCEFYDFVFETKLWLQVQVIRITHEWCGWFVRVSCTSKYTLSFAFDNNVFEIFVKQLSAAYVDEDAL